MDKKKAISIITKAAKAYHDNLEDRKVAFIYGVPSNVKKELELKIDSIGCLECYEVAFHKSNFLHLTGVRLNTKTTKSSKHFYEKCLDGRLSEDDFYMAKDGSTDQKLEVIEGMMDIRHKAAMIGDFTDKGPKLFTEKVAGTTLACIGFVKDLHTKLNVPNTLLKKDIREVTSKPQKKVYAVLSKEYTESYYSVIDKIDKNLEGLKVELIENLMMSIL